MFGNPNFSILDASILTMGLVVKEINLYTCTALIIFQKL